MAPRTAAAAVALMGLALDGARPRETDFRMRVFGAGDLDVLFVRLVRAAAAP